MKLRSLLFVPGDRPDRMEKAREAGADALILDLEDSVTPARKAMARAAVSAFLSDRRGLRVFVRINPVDSDIFADDLAAILPHMPDGVVLPKAEGAKHLDCLKDAGVAMPILPIATETPRAIFKLGDYADGDWPLAGLTWGAEDLPAAIGATTARDGDGQFTAPYEMIRSLTLFAAHAAGAPAIETVFPDVGDLDGLHAYAARGYRDGFSGMMAIHPAQVAIINTAFSPTSAQIAHARAVVGAFETNSESGALMLDGRMIDAPHLKAAKRLLAQADRAER